MCKLIILEYCTSNHIMHWNNTITITIYETFLYNNLRRNRDTISHNQSGVTSFVLRLIIIILRRK